MKHATKQENILYGSYEIEQNDCVYLFWPQSKHLKVNIKVYESNTELCIEKGKKGFDYLLILSIISLSTSKLILHKKISIKYHFGLATVLSNQK